MRGNAISRLLPGVYQASAAEGTPLAALLDVMEGLHAPDEAILADIDAYFDPYLAPPAFVPYLARWVDVDWLLGDPDRDASDVPAAYPAGLGRLRNVVALAAELSSRRGTAEGLRAFLETATGVRGFEVEATAGGRPFHIRVRAPAAVADAGLESLVERIVEHERPAHATFEVTHEGRPDRPADPEDPPDGADDSPSDAPDAHAEQPDRTDETSTEQQT